MTTRQRYKELILQALHKTKATIGKPLESYKLEDTVARASNRLSLQIAADRPLTPELLHSALCDHTAKKVKVKRRTFVAALNDLDREKAINIRRYGRRYLPIPIAIRPSGLLPDCFICLKDK
jgi:hypothetical protein